jgi:hypothetical protein
MPPKIESLFLWELLVELLQERQLSAKKYLSALESAILKRTAQCCLSTVFTRSAPLSRCATSGVSILTIPRSLIGNCSKKFSSGCNRAKTSWYPTMTTRLAKGNLQEFYLNGLRSLSLKVFLLCWTERSTQDSWTSRFSFIQMTTYV